MDKYESKYDIVLDIIEHPDNYTSGQLEDILSDPETREIYNLLCKTESAVKADNKIDVDAEWERFSKKYAMRPRRSFLWFGSRAASIAAVVGTSLVAVAAGIAVTVSVIDHKSEPIAEEAMPATSVSTVTTDTLSAVNDTVRVVIEPVMFEDETLENIMKGVSDAYGVEVMFNNKEAASLHLYYKLDPSLPLDEVVEQLNTFEQIDIKRNGNILNID